MSSGFATRTAIASPIPGESDGSSERSRPLVVGNALLLLVVIVHATLDTTRDWSGPFGLPLTLWAAAFGLLAVILLALTLSLRDDPRAPTATMLAGGIAAFGGLLGHAGPAWGPFSISSFWATGSHADAVSWVLLTCVFVVGLGVSAVGRKARSRSASRRRSGASMSMSHNPGRGD